MKNLLSSISGVVMASGLATTAIAQEPPEPKTLDQATLSQLPDIIDLPAHNDIQLDLSGKSKTLQCAAEAVSSIDITDGGLRIEEREYNNGNFEDAGQPTFKQYNFIKGRSSLVRTDNESAVILNYDKPDAVELAGYNMHDIKVSITLTEDQKNIDFRAEHSGSYNSKVDSVDATIGAVIGDTRLEHRQGGALNHDPDAARDDLDSPKGQWVIGAVQTLEAHFTSCMNITSPQRLEGSATSVEKPPITTGTKINAIPGFENFKP